MKFESMLHSYKVINLLYSNAKYDIYLCEHSEKFILLYIKSEKLRLYCCKLFLELLEEKSFDGIKEIFTDRDNLIVVLQSAELSETFAKNFKEEDAALIERLKLMYDILSGFCIHAVPIPIAYDLFLHNNVGLMPDGNSGCRYELYEIEKYDEIGIKQFSELLAKKCRGLFEAEKNENEIQNFCSMLEQNPPENLLSVFDRYNDLYKLYQQKLADGSMYQNNGKKKLIKIAKIAVNALKILLTIAVLAAAVWLLLKAAFPEKGETGTISQIGEISIEEYETEQ